MSLPTLTPASTVSAIVLPTTGSRTEIDSLVPYRVYSDTSAPLYSTDFLSGAADQVAYVYKKLGGDILDIELTAGNVYAAYEEACLEYSYIINIHQASNVLSDALGNATGTFDHKGQIKAGPLSSSLKGTHVGLKYPRFEYGTSKRVTEGISAHAGLGHSVEYSASFAVSASVQDYDLQTIISSVKNVAATGKLTFASCPATNETITLQDSSGLSIVFTYTRDNNNTTGNGSIGVAAASVQGGGDANKAQVAAIQTAAEINAHPIKITATIDAQDNKIVNLTQDIANDAGNTTIVDGSAHLTVTSFTGGVTTTPYAEKIHGNRIQVKKVFYKTPHAMWRFYGYYGGLNVVGNLNNYGQFSDDSTFQLVPTWQNKSQALAFEDAIYTRMSHYSYEIKDNKLRLFPEPGTGGPQKMWVQFSIPRDAYMTSSANDPTIDGINNMNTLPLGNLPYGNINSIGKQWIRRFALSLCKETLGQVRSKFSTVPIPGESVTLNGSDLISQARDEQDKLREELKATLAELTYARLTAIDAEKVEASERVIQKVPVNIFVG